VQQSHKEYRAMSSTVLSIATYLPRHHGRRFRLWLFLMAGSIAILGTQVLVPQWHILPGSVQADYGWAVFAIFAAAVICEYMDASLGMGYGTTLTPLLLVFGFEPLQIVPAVLLSELFTGVASGLMHQRDGNVDFLRDAAARHTTLLLTALSAIGAVLAVSLAVQISKFWLGLIITAIVMSMGVVILATRHRQLRYRAGAIVAVGAVAAFNKGLSGGGYGPLVTAGQVVSGLPAKRAVAVTSVAEAATCLVGLLAYLVAGKTIAWHLAVPLTLGALLSVPMATVTIRHLPEHVVRGLVGTLTLLLGLVALLKLIG
jgi:uncharacterized membrane protein YfcA